jgi:hypothetical protein
MLNNPKMEDYSFKRKNLDEAILTFDKNNNFTITLPKFLKEKRQKIKRYDDNKKEEIKSVTKLYKSMDNVKNIKNEQYLKERQILNDNLKLTEKEQNILYESLKTKPSFLKNKKNHFSNDINQNTFLTETTEINNNNNNNNNNNDNNNSKIIKPKFLTPIQREKLQFLSELTIFDDVEKIKLKTKILKDIKLKENKKKFKLHPIDLFHYDEFRWRKQTDDKTIFEKEKKANEIEKDTKLKLVKMKSEVSKVQKIAKDSVQIVEETFKEIENRQKPKEELPKKLPQVQTEKRALSFVPGNPKSFEFEEALKVVQSKVRGKGKYIVVNEGIEEIDENEFDNEKQNIRQKSKKSSKKIKKVNFDKIEEVNEDKNNEVKDENNNDIKDVKKEEKEKEKKQENLEEKNDEKKEEKNEEKKEENKNEDKGEEKNEENKEN